VAFTAPFTTSYLSTLHTAIRMPTSRIDALTRLPCERMNVTPEEVRTMDGLRHGRIDTELGELVVVARDEALTGVYFPGHWTLPEPDAFGEPAQASADPVLSVLAEQLDDYLAGERRTFEVSVRTDGDDFSQRVWAMLQEIPYGETTTYGALAERLGNRHLAQRVGQVVGRNPVSIVIPCHRVVGSDGSLTGYAGGLERKQRLLDLEDPTTAESRLF
jgi:methylated-DNA-[protein]-cysteine S-methyltransferase